jgi:hypothetical protein
MADAAGRAQVSAVLPPILSGSHVWLQACANGALSNPIEAPVL